MLCASQKFPGNLNTALNLDFTFNLEMHVKHNPDVCSLLTMEVLITHALYSFSLIFFLHDEVKVNAVRDAVHRKSLREPPPGLVWLTLANGPMGMASAGSL